MSFFGECFHNIIKISFVLLLYVYLPNTELEIIIMEQTYLLNKKASISVLKKTKNYNHPTTRSAL